MPLENTIASVTPWWRMQEDQARREAQKKFFGYCSGPTERAQLDHGLNRQQVYVFRKRCKTYPFRDGTGDHELPSYGL